MSSLLFKPFQDYIKNLCVLHKSVLHEDGVRTSFVRFQSHEDLTSIPQNAGSMIVVMGNYVGRTIGDFDENKMRQNATIMFLKRVQAGTGNPAKEIEDAQKEALDVLFDFHARMKYDYTQDDCGPLQFIRAELMTWQPVDGPVLEDHYGWEMTMPHDAGYPAYNAANWNEPPEEPEP